ncbi:MAG: hypothetical protein HUJ86_05400, partial [Synergistes sp.]|nr:hypothetical protein [Synergistes sp.]
SEMKGEMDAMRAENKENRSKINELEAKDKEKDKIIESLKNALEEKKK